MCGKSNLQLPEIGPNFVADRLENLPAPLQFVGVELGSDDDGHYIVTVRGRLETASRVLPFVYQRVLRVVGSLDPGRPERVVKARVGAISFLEFQSDPTDPNPATEGYTALAAGGFTGAVIEPAPRQLLFKNWLI